MRRFRTGTKSSVGWVAVLFALMVLAVALCAGLFYINNKSVAYRMQVETRLSENEPLSSQIRIEEGN